jgi:hypothetical protein
VVSDRPWILPSMLGNLSQVVTRVCARSCGKLKIVYKGAQSGNVKAKSYIYW